MAMILLGIFIEKDNDSGLATKYRLYRTVRAVSGETKTKTFSIGSPEKFKRITLPETNVIEILSVKDSVIEKISSLKIE